MNAILQKERFNAYKREVQPISEHGAALPHEYKRNVQESEKIRTSNDFVIECHRARSVHRLDVIQWRHTPYS